MQFSSPKQNCQLWKWLMINYEHFITVIMAKFPKSFTINRVLCFISWKKVWLTLIKHTLKCAFWTLSTSLAKSPLDGSRNSGTLPLSGSWYNRSNFFPKKSHCMKPTRWQARKFIFTIKLAKSTQLNNLFHCTNEDVGIKCVIKIKCKNAI